MIITWIGQSGYILKTSNTEIIIDPYLSDIVNKVANRPRMVEVPIKPQDIKADAIICTHNHLDHLDPEAIEKMNKLMLFVCPSYCEEKLKSLGCKKIQTLEVSQSITVGDFKLTAVYANHTVDTIGILAEANGKKLYFTSDTIYDEKLKEMSDYKLDIMFICINGKLGNMNVDEAIDITNDVKPKIAVPTHYGMFASNTENPKKFTSRISNGFEMKYNIEYNFTEINGGLKNE